MHPQFPMPDFAYNDTLYYNETDGIFPFIPSSYASPFKQVIATGNGYCGSTCAQMTTMSYLYRCAARTRPLGPAIHLIARVID